MNEAPPGYGRALLPQRTSALKIACQCPRLAQRLKRLQIVVYGT